MDRRILSRERTIGLVLLALIAGWSILFCYAVHPALPFNPIRLPFESIVQARVWMPEGWAFFTRDPREEQVLILAQAEGGQWRSASIGPNSDPSNWFGLSRASRAQGIEMGLLLVRIPDTAWQPCRLAPEACLAAISGELTLHNESPRPTLCGPVGLAKQKQVPWAWSASGPKITMPSTVVRLGVIC